MRYAKGTYVITKDRDIPLLRHVRNARFISHQQLFELAEVDGLGSSRSAFNWRVARLIKTGHIKLVEGASWHGSRVYFITARGLAELESNGEFLLAMPSRNRQTPDRARLPHALELNALRLHLARQALLVHWQSEVEVSSANMMAAMMAGGGYAKNYDAIVKIWAGDEVREFALEYERTLKNAKQYEKIGAALDGEQRIGCVLYLAANGEILATLASQIITTFKRVAFATAHSFTAQLLDTLVTTDTAGAAVSFAEFLRFAHPLYI